MSNLISSVPAGSLPAEVAQSGAVDLPSAQILTRHRQPLHALTGLRFFAASYVIIFHSRLGAALFGRGLVYAGNFIANGYLAVTLFFILSGFILAYNYRDQIETRDHVFRFWEARFARIWPAYIFSLLCVTVGYLVIPHPGMPSFPVAVATIFMVQSWDPFHAQIAGAWNPVCWSLSVEAFFYLVFPWLQTFLERLRLAQLFVFGACIGIIAILADTPFHTMGGRYPGLWFYIVQPIIHLPTFISGVVVGNIFLQYEGVAAGIKNLTLPRSAQKSVNRSGIPIVTMVGLASSILVLCIVRGRWEGLAVPSFACLLYGLAVERTLLSRFLSLPLLILGGEISYSMYLLRYSIQIWVQSFPALHKNALVDYLYIPIVVVPLSWLSYRFIEIPSRRVLRRLFARLQVT